MSTRQKHVVFGAGQVGPHLAARLAALGHEVSMASRSGRGSVAGVTAVAADATDARACATAVQGAAVVYHCMNPKYDIEAWRTQLPRIQQNLVSACGDAGARLVMLDNVYALGRTAGVPMNEDSPAHPCSRKGEVRARLVDDLLSAHRRGDVAVVIGRASDFFGPRGVQTMFDQRFWTRAIAGRPAQVLVNPDTPHTYHYIPDVAAALATLGAAEPADVGRIWMLPCEPAITTRALIGHFGTALGRDLPVSRVPRWLFGLMKLAVPVFREIDETLYQWDAPFVVDDRRFRARFASVTTPVEEAARQTVAWARDTYSTP